MKTMIKIRLDKNLILCYNNKKGGDDVEMSSILEIISSVGFPIACCIAMFLQQNKITENHKSEMSEMKKAIDNNTIALTKLIENLK